MFVCVKNLKVSNAGEEREGAVKKMDQTETTNKAGREEVNMEDISP